MDVPDPSQAPPVRMVLVFRSATIPEGLLARGLLESAGITVVVKGESEGPYRLGPVDLWVAEADEAEARAVLAEARPEPE